MFVRPKGFERSATSRKDANDETVGQFMDPRWLPLNVFGNSEKKLRGLKKKWSLLVLFIESLLVMIYGQPSN